jgi:N-acetylglucosaminyl-diphospho-decaprenol L-rhamnosyltransferase
MLAIIIVSWNVRELLRGCLSSLSQFSATSHPQTVIVVDNASTDGSVAMMRSDFPEITVIANSTNRGFTGGNNDGINAAENFFSDQPDGNCYVLLLNPDTVVTPGALNTLLAYAGSHDDVAVAGPMLLNADGTHQSSRRRFPTLSTALFESTWLQPLAPQGLLDRYYCQEIADTSICDVDWLVGAALLVRRSAYHQVGLLDDKNFFMYSEEIDWCRRIKSASASTHWRVVYVPDAQIIHYEGRSSIQVSAKRMIYFNTSKVHYFIKHHGTAQAQTLRLFLLAHFVTQLLIESAKWLVGHKRALRQERIMAYREVLRSGLK